ncbi:MAG: DNA methyltransferase [Coprobacter sp.]
MPVSIVRNVDCMSFMMEIPDKFFSLAVVDPPYGLPQKSMQGVGKLKNRILNRMDTSWDKAPGEEYFKELFRVSRNQIIWGGNFFLLPPTRGFLVWDKLQPFPNFSRCEYAWTSFNCPSKLFAFDNRRGDKKIHPTQKPISLYKWIYEKFAHKGDTILDTHLGSGSNRIAAYFMNLDFYATEINPSFFELQNKWFQEKCNQDVKAEGIIRQQSLF